MITKRKLASWQGVNQCSVCRMAKNFTPATHSTTDSKQQPDGTWRETAPRFGCGKHAVTPNVIFLDGTIKPFSEAALAG